MGESTTKEDKYRLADTFIQRIHDKDLVITKEASKIQFSRPMDGGIKNILGVKVQRARMWEI
jgi:hypothetical protein